MKKGWKIFLIVCASVAVVGLALCITGAAMGATFGGVNRAFGYDSYVWHDNDYEDDHDYSDMDEYNDNEENFNSSEQPKVTQGTAGKSENTFEFSGIKEFELNASYIEIDVKTHEQDIITVDTSGLKNGLEKYVVFENEESELKIEITNRKKWESFAHKSAGRMVIWIPENLTFLDASFDVGACYLKIDSIKAEELSINVGAGRTVVKDFIASDLEVGCGAGQSILSGTVNGSADIECGVGEAKLALNGNEHEYDYQLKCDVGQITVGDNKYSGLGNEKHINNGTGNEIDIDCGVGNVEVTFNR